MRNALALGSASILTLATFTAPPDAAAAAPNLFFTTVQPHCGVTTAMQLRIDNQSSTSIPAGTAYLGTFTATYGTIAANTTVFANLTSTTPWACDGASTKLVLRSAGSLIKIPAKRQTTWIDIELEPLIGNHIEIITDDQEVICNGDDGDIEVEAQVDFPYSGGDYVYRFDGALTSAFDEIDGLSWAQQSFDLHFYYEDGACPHVDEAFSLIVDGPGAPIERHGWVLPSYERLTGGIVY